MMQINPREDAKGLHHSCIVLPGFDLAVPEEMPVVNNEIVTYLGKRVRIKVII